jgi:pyruvate/2-oxoglutarate dehydrogenase complex dihydrolipoamide dehydrogenase (E3) component
MAQTERYDAIIIGDGQAGGPLSTALAGAGRTVAVIEREHAGGTCINEGCTPTKTMVASARTAYLARRSADYGVHTAPVWIDMVRVRQRKRDIVESFRSSSQQRVESAAGVDLLMGTARFTGPRSVEVRLKSGELRQLSADTIFINTGDRPAVPPLPGLDTVPFLDSTTIMELDAVPEHLLILGGGYIAVEFGQMFRRFGSAVTIVQRGPQLLAREDADIAAAVAAILREDGITIFLESEAQRVERADGGPLRVVARTPDGECTLEGSRLLVVVGRLPNTDDLNLAAAGVETSRGGYIRVNERLETTAPGIYALGDVKGGPAFTHISYDDFRIIRANLLEGGHRATTDRLVPYTVFMDPQLGRVGLSEREAHEQGRRVRIATMPMSYVARALEVDEPRGVMKAVVDAETDKILGCAVLGIEGGELMAMVEIAMMGGLPYTALRDGIFAHPTLAESFNNLFATLDG